MAADQERAERIRQLKADHPEIRWRMVAEHVGVTERAAQEWQKTGGIEAANAKKLAELFDVSYEWLWFGRELANDGGQQTPDLLGAAKERQVDDGFEEFREYVRAIRADIEAAREEAHREREQIGRLLQAQQAILERMETVAAGLPSDDTLQALTEAARRLEEVSQDDEEDTGGSSAAEA